MLSEKSQNTISIAVDSMGGDGAPDVVLDGVRQALAAEPRLTVLLTGPKDIVKPFAKATNKAYSQLRVVAIATTEFIGMDEHPVAAVRSKKDSSIVVGCKMVKQSLAKGFFSAGSTGACMAAATLVIGRAKGVLRPAIATQIPAPKGDVLLLDVGANADVKPDVLLQFALLGQAFAQRVMNVANPRVALLNIGSEKSKGSMLAQETHALLAAVASESLEACNNDGTDVSMSDAKEVSANAKAHANANANASCNVNAKANANANCNANANANVNCNVNAKANAKANPLNFIGNIEGNDILQGCCDVIITDGFTGNVVLKTIEGAVSSLFSEVKAVFASSLKTKLAGALVLGDFQQLKNQLSAERVGGSPLLGVNGAVVIGHGSSSARAISNGILATFKAVESGFLNNIASILSSEHAHNE
ncbi:MAG: phosphate acyltransferase [Coriobacteriales bacterium]|jgi:fatty acid/phospholipid biosynthesis enzyme|nr:phosphate acyltransferase [Coriobacteriales bacterium]